MAALTRWLLPASFALNVFLGAALLVHALRPDFGPPPPPPPPGKLVEKIAATLPPADAEILRQAFATLPEREGRPRGPEEFHRRLREALLAPNFDAEALRHSLAEGRAERDRFDLALEHALITAATAMSVEGRRKLADWRPPGPPRGGPGGPPPPRP